MKLVVFAGPFLVGAVLTIVAAQAADVQTTLSLGIPLLAFAASYGGTLVALKETKEKLDTHLTAHARQDSEIEKRLDDISVKVHQSPCTVFQAHTKAFHNGG